MIKRVGSLTEISPLKGEKSRNPYKHFSPPAEEMEAATTAKDTTSNLRRNNFRWNNYMVHHLINSLLEYKRLTMYKNLDFDADKPMQYKEQQIKRVSIYKNQDQNFFSQVEAEAFLEKLKYKRDGFSQSSC